MQLDAAELGVRKHIDNTGYSIRTVECGSTVAKHLHSIDRTNWERIRVGGLDGNKVLCLRSRRQDQTSAVDQHQSVARANTAQIDGCIVTARIVQITRGAGFLEVHISSLGQRPEQIIPRHAADRSDLGSIDDRDGKRLLEPRNPRTGNRHRFNLFHGGTVRCRRNRGLRWNAGWRLGLRLR